MPKKPTDHEHFVETIDRLVFELETTGDRLLHNTRTLILRIGVLAERLGYPWPPVQIDAVDYGGAGEHWRVTWHHPTEAAWLMRTLYVDQRDGSCVRQPLNDEDFGSLLAWLRLWQREVEQRRPRKRLSTKEVVRRIKLACLERYEHHDLSDREIAERVGLSPTQLSRDDQYQRAACEAHAAAAPKKSFSKIDEKTGELTFETIDDEPGKAIIEEIDREIDKTLDKAIDAD